MRRNTDSTWHRPLRAVPLLLVALAAALTATMLTPGAANASAPNPGTVVTPIQPVPGMFGKHATLPVDFLVGDCVALAEAGITKVDLGEPDVFGNSLVTWTQRGYSTDPSSGGDIWHATFDFYDAVGRHIATSPTMDSPAMKVRNQLATWTKQTSVKLVPRSLFNDIVTVVWTGRC